MSSLEDQIRSLGIYSIEDHRWLSDIGSDSFVLRHIKSGARLAILPNKDSNKVFFIAFRTPPSDSTGVAHIIEHTVLCGSRDFPVKDPFVEVAKGSLNTFLNAMTYPDKTVYPVASTNEKDFDNLMHVYLDAVFHPNIYTERNIFRQEGWHYEVTERGTQTAPAAEDDREAHRENGAAGERPACPVISVNGVVYNEMKGVMSSPEDVLADQVLASLFPDTTYAFVSGGDPMVIPTLTYERYLEFHRRYYHPCNSYIYLYGDMDVMERLVFLDRAYLSEYGRIPLDSRILPQRPFDTPGEVTGAYSIQRTEDPAGKAFLSWNVALPVTGSAKEILAFRILDYVLCDAEGAPVREALLKAGIGQNVVSTYESGLLEPYYSITAQYTDPDRKEEFLRVIRSVLERLSENGIPKRSLKAGINYYEFQYREADFGSFPKGLVYGLDICDSWLYDDTQVWTGLEAGICYEELKKDAEKGYFENLIRRYLLDNPHRSTVLLLPVQGLSEKAQEKQAGMLAEYAASLSEDELQRLREEEASLRKWQESPDREENLRKIPVLKRKDLCRKARDPVNERLGTFVTGHPVFTSGIDYVDVTFDVTELSEQELRWLSVCKVLLGALATERFSYGELDNEINIATGGMTPAVSSSYDAKDPSDYRILFSLQFRVMHGNLAEAAALAEEILLRTSFDDAVRIREVLEEERTSMKTELPASGHMTAATRALSYLSVSGKLVDDIAGIGAYRFLEDLCRNYDAERDRIAQEMRRLLKKMLVRDRLLIDVTASPENLPEAAALLEEMAAAFPQSAEGRAAGPGSDGPSCTLLNEGFTTAGQVQYVCRAGNYLKKGLPYTGALRVLKVILGYDYLWTRIRMKGGAYGCMSSFGRDGSAYFVTYRDPHLGRSLGTFEEAADYIRRFEADDRTMTKYVIGAVSAMDRPMTPGMFGRFCRSCRLMGLTREDLQRDRDQVLDCSVEDIRGLSDYIDAFMGDGALCVIGPAGKLEEEKALFRTLETL